MNNNYKSKYVPRGKVFGGTTKFYIYPDFRWDVKNWGPKPMLGTVYADDEFYAVREAYSEGLAPINFTFGLVATKENADTGYRRFKSNYKH